MFTEGKWDLGIGPLPHLRGAVPPSYARSLRVTAIRGFRALTVKIMHALYVRLSVGAHNLQVHLLFYTSSVGRPEPMRLHHASEIGPSATGESLGQFSKLRVDYTRRLTPDPQSLSALIEQGPDGRCLEYYLLSKHVYPTSPKIPWIHSVVPNGALRHAATYR